MDQVISKYLQSGEQTQVTPKIWEIATTFQGATLEKAKQIIQRISQLESRQFQYDIFRKRTDSQILEDGFVTGCIDSALAFITLARASGIPAKYVETISKKWVGDLTCRPKMTPKLFLMKVWIRGILG